MGGSKNSIIVFLTSFQANGMGNRIFRTLMLFFAAFN